VRTMTVLALGAASLSLLALLVLVNAGGGAEALSLPPRRLSLEAPGAHGPAPSGVALHQASPPGPRLVTSGASAPPMAQPAMVAEAGPPPPPALPPMAPGPAGDGRVFEDYAQMVDDLQARGLESLGAVWKETTDLNNDIVASSLLAPEQKAALILRLKAVEAEKAAALPEPKAVGWTRKFQSNRPDGGYLVEVQFDR
jgi:hypothetical protein